MSEILFYVLSAQTLSGPFNKLEDAIANASDADVILRADGDFVLSGYAVDADGHWLHEHDRADPYLYQSIAGLGS
jgi:hypothetical protein